MEEDIVSEFDLINPTEAHSMLREMIRDFVDKSLEPQALIHDKEEKFNLISKR